jgi:hypothetical protein
VCQKKFSHHTLNHMEVISTSEEEMKYFFGNESLEKESKYRKNEEYVCVLERNRYDYRITEKDKGLD